MTNKFRLVAANFFAQPEKYLQKFGKSVVLAAEAAKMLSTVLSDYYKHQ